MANLRWTGEGLARGVGRLSRLSVSDAQLSPERVLEPTARMPVPHLRCQLSARLANTRARPLWSCGISR